MDSVSRGWWVLGWSAKLRWEPLAGLYEATTPELPGVGGTGSGRSEALAELSAQVAREVGMSPETPAWQSRAEPENVRGCNPAKERRLWLR